MLSVFWGVRSQIIAVINCPHRHGDLLNPTAIGMLESLPSWKLFEKLKKIDEGMMFRKGQKTKSVDDLSAWIEDTIREFCLNSPDNSLRNGENEGAFEEPHVGFSNGGDPLYRELQKDIGTPFMTPIEIFEKSFPGVPAEQMSLQ